MRILAVGAELLHEEKGTDGRTDRRTNIMKLIVAFRNLAKKTAREDHETLEYTDIYVTVFYCTSSKKILPKFREKLLPYFPRRLILAQVDNRKWRVENSHPDRPQHTEHATRTVQTLNQWLCEQLCELS
jgi:hypothetical protein